MLKSKFAKFPPTKLFSYKVYDNTTNLTSHTILPVIGVPIQSSALNGLDSLLSIVQMPGGVPVATMSIGKAGATNAAIYAAKILSLSNKEIDTKLTNWLSSQKENVPLTPNLKND